MISWANWCNQYFWSTWALIYPTCEKYLVYLIFYYFLLLLSYLFSVCLKPVLLRVIWSWKFYYWLPILCGITLFASTCPSKSYVMAFQKIKKKMMKIQKFKKNQKGKFIFFLSYPKSRTMLIWSWHEYVNSLPNGRWCPLYFIICLKLRQCY